MKNNKILIIATTSIIVIGIIYLGFKNSNISKDDIKNEDLRKDFESVIDKIDKAKT